MTCLLSKWHDICPKKHSYAHTCAHTHTHTQHTHSTHTAHTQHIHSTYTNHTHTYTHYNHTHLYTTQFICIHAPTCTHMALTHAPAHLCILHTQTCTNTHKHTFNKVGTTVGWSVASRRFSGSSSLGCRLCLGLCSSNCGFGGGLLLVALGCKTKLVSEKSVVWGTSVDLCEVSKYIYAKFLL